MDFEKYKANIMLEGLISDLGKIVINKKVEDIAEIDKFKSFIDELIMRLDQVDVILKEFKIKSNDFLQKFEKLIASLLFNEENKSKMSKSKTMLQLLQFDVCFEFIKYRLSNEKDINKIFKNLQKIIIFLDSSNSTDDFLSFIEVLLSFPFFVPCFSTIEDIVTNVLQYAEKEELLINFNELFNDYKRKNAFFFLKHGRKIVKETKQRSRRCSSIEGLAEMNTTLNAFINKKTKDDTEIKVNSDIVFSSLYNSNKSNLFEKSQKTLFSYFKVENKHKDDEYISCKRTDSDNKAKSCSFFNNLSFQTVANIEFTNTEKDKDKKEFINSKSTNKSFFNSTNNSFNKQPLNRQITFFNLNNESSIKSIDDLKLKEEDFYSQMSESICNKTKHSFSMANVKKLVEENKKKRQLDNSEVDIIDSSSIGYSFFQDSFKQKAKSSFILNQNTLPLIKKAKKNSAKKTKITQIEKLLGVKSKSENNQNNQNEENIVISKKNSTNESTNYFSNSSFYKKDYIITESPLKKNTICYPSGFSNDKSINNPYNKDNNSILKDKPILSIFKNTNTPKRLTYSTKDETTQLNKLKENSDIRERFDSNSSENDVLAMMTPDDHDRYNTNINIQQTRKNLIEIFKQADE